MLPPAEFADLYAVAGYACTLLAWISGDLGQLAAAETHARTAWLCADLTDSSELKAWVLSTRSKTAFWDHRLADAADFARGGQQFGASNSVAVLLAAQEADAAAAMGRSADARSALASAADYRDRVATPDAVGGLLSCSSARLSNYAAGVYLRTDQPDEALREAAGALDQRLTSIYLPGQRSRNWVKTKNTSTQEVVIGGWSPGQGRRGGGIGSLLLGIPDPPGTPDLHTGGGLRYVGHVGTGFTTGMLTDLAHHLNPLTQDRSPFTAAAGVPHQHTRGAHWVQPILVGEVAYSEWTPDHILRHPSWRGIRPDKQPTDVHQELLQ